MHGIWSNNNIKGIKTMANYTRNSYGEIRVTRSDFEIWQNGSTAEAIADELGKLFRSEGLNG